MRMYPGGDYKQIRLRNGRAFVQLLDGFSGQKGFIPNFPISCTVGSIKHVLRRKGDLANSFEGL